MKAALFPGQGSQFIGMGADLASKNERANQLFHQANDILGFDILSIMLNGPEEKLKQTNITQPAVFIHSLAALAANRSEIEYDYVAGHSLGELSALVAAECISFGEGLLLVKERAESMHYACEKQPGTMAAILGLDNGKVEEVCAEIDGIVVAANYNCPGQLVISGEVKAVKSATDMLKAAGAKRAVLLNVGGAFHSELMRPAQDRLAQQIEKTTFHEPLKSIYQNVSAQAESEADKIKKNLLKQLTSPVRWTQTIQQMVADGIDSFVEIGGNGKTLSSFVRRVSKDLSVESYI